MGDSDDKGVAREARYNEDEGDKRDSDEIGDNDVGDDQGDLNCGYNNIGTVDDSDKS